MFGDKYEKENNDILILFQRLFFGVLLQILQIAESLLWQANTIQRAYVLAVFSK